MEGKVVVVTGGASGIGRAICLELAKKNAKVVVADVNSSMDTIMLMKQANDSVQVVEAICDISNAEQVNAMVQTAIDQFGRIDCAVNNAGILGMMARIGEYEESMFNKMIDINIKGTWNCIRAQVRAMEKQGAGKYSIVNVSSIAGVLAFPYNSAYSCVKHALLGLTKSTAAEYGSSGIRCNAVLPGASDTPMLRSYVPTEEAVAGLKAITPLHRFSDPEEIAKPILFLLSEESSYVTGQNLIVDGGLSVV
ncbi:short-chain dehydrogenase/reductase family protein [Heterostelium album PN500]|uniref:Short-chain dehydrogenase/reductase family protein n=1 Tax=Heterostelium pallidum (strain ATCC 26659 / Pp 5 / PN500) TaxID=670386 RepID=D3BHM9_HETP5|nr:short-chain dehydrogenase/reductase family protein [Heterostelium album PN500]EFA79206.1 short-chain dehydrogenase/reductase family protein [Heterostelium album PN500]|eukprot:XP_020431327.1 short-chain dehydrogenase/reductase family protein [Heterostelium album PN500]